jgi:hypothetical protein
LYDRRLLTGSTAHRRSLCADACTEPLVTRPDTKPDTKIVMVLREGLPPNVATNAAAVLGLSLGGRLPHLIGADGRDSFGGVHAGLNTNPVPVVIAANDQIAELHGKARERADLVAVGFTEVARRARDYRSYLDDLVVTPGPDLEYVGLALFGPRNKVTALTKRFPLLGSDELPTGAAATGS